MRVQEVVPLGATKREVEEAMKERERHWSSQVGGAPAAPSALCLGGRRKQARQVCLRSRPRARRCSAPRLSRARDRLAGWYVRRPLFHRLPLLRRPTCAPPRRPAQWPRKLAFAFDNGNAYSPDPQK
jgi:hypothetical protein